MRSEMVWMIIGMGIVTFLPRMLPFVMFRGKELPPFIQGILKNVPYATLGALIFPGILFIQDDMIFGIMGAAVAFLIAFLGVNVIFVVLGTIVILSIISF